MNSMTIRKATLVGVLAGWTALLSATTAHAVEGVSLRWSSCLGDGGASNRNFACDTNAGTNVLVGSFELGTPLAQVSSAGVQINVWFGQLGLPAWWAFVKPGLCRQTSLAVNTALPPTGLNCVDWASGQSAGSVGDYHININGFGTASILVVTTVPASELADLQAGQEYFSFNLTIDNAKTVGSSSCGGCAIPVCLSLLSFRLTTPVAANNREITTAMNGSDSYFAAWQGGATRPPNVVGCPEATPTRRETWGAVKSLYH